MPQWWSAMQPTPVTLRMLAYMFLKNREVNDTERPWLVGKKYIILVLVGLIVLLVGRKYFVVLFLPYCDISQNQFVQTEENV